MSLEPVPFAVAVCACGFQVSSRSEERTRSYLRDHYGMVRWSEGGVSREWRFCPVEPMPGTPRCVEFWRGETVAEVKACVGRPT